MSPKARPSPKTPCPCCGEPRAASTQARHLARALGVKLLERGLLAAGECYRQLRAAGIPLEAHKTGWYQGRVTSADNGRYEQQWGPAWAVRFYARVSVRGKLLVQALTLMQQDETFRRAACLLADAREFSVTILWAGVGEPQNVRDERFAAGRAQANKRLAGLMAAWKNKREADGGRAQAEEG